MCAGSWNAPPTPMDTPTSGNSAPSRCTHRVPSCSARVVEPGVAVSVSTTTTSSVRTEVIASGDWAMNRRAVAPAARSATRALRWESPAGGSRMTDRTRCSRSVS